MKRRVNTVTNVSVVVLLAVVMSITGCSDDSVAEPPMQLAPLAGGSFGGGSGTPGAPYLIQDLDDLQAMSSNLSAYYALANDIDLSAFDWGAWGDGNGFLPVGDATNRFSGGFDGRGFIITGLNINRPTTNNVGLFGHVGDDTGTTVIKNVQLVDTAVIGARGTGALIGRVTGNANTLIENCSAVGGSVTGNGATGGLIGSFNSWRTTPGGDDNPILRYSYTDVAVSSSATGGGRDKFGGLVGCSQKGTIQNSYSRSSVTVTDGSRIGGLAGCLDYRGEILNSYSTGLVTVTDCTSFGGLVGNVVGPGFNVGVVTNSFWDMQTSGQITSAGGTGKPTNEMKTEATFTDVGWNFGDIWNIDPGVNDAYPHLVWRDFQPVVLTITGTFTADSKIYDGSNLAQFATHNLTLSGVSVGHNVTLVDVVIRFSDAYVGSNKTVNITSAALAGPDADKYILYLGGAPTATADITPLTINVTADPQSKTYGDSDPVLTYQYAPALVGSDTFTGALSRVTGEGVGTYAIVQGTLALSGNYTLNYTSANLTITELTIYVVADSQSKVQGDVDPPLTYNYSPEPLPFGDSFSGALTRVAGEAAGTYEIEQGTLALSSNYTLDYTGNYLTITTAQTYTISGTITVNSGLAGVSVAATGGHSQTVTTNAAGEYTLTGVAHGATDIVITPTLAGYTFSPTSRTVTDVTDDVVGQDFTASFDAAPITVGWETHSVNKLAVIAPWIAVFAAIIAGASLLVLRRRRAAS